MMNTSHDPVAVTGQSISPTSSPAALSAAEVIAAATAVLVAHADSTPQEQATAVRSWWLDTTQANGHPPCAFAVLSLVLPTPAFAIAFQAHFDAVIAAPPRAMTTPRGTHRHQDS